MEPLGFQDDEPIGKVLLIESSGLADATTNMPEGHMYNRPFSNETVTPSIPSRVVITLPIDADVLHWLQRQPAWQQEINDLCRAYMESHLIREMAFEEGGQ